VPRLVVLHYTAMTAPEPAMDWLCTPASQVSAHYLIARTGTVTRLVPETARAWHAGAGAWGGCPDVNSASIGIELDNDGASPFAAPLMDALEALLGEILARWDLPPEAVIGHSDMAPGRKIDPGPRFDWRRLARAGLAIWPEPTPDAGLAPDPARFAADLARFGMTHPVPRDTRLAAFRLRFRPGATGPLAPADMALARDLGRQWPVDPALGRG
jgi:N-acetylmuramoyl-L-alanine amidase